MEGGACGTETGGGRDPRTPGARPGGVVGVPGVRQGVPPSRPPGGAEVAAPRHVPVPDDPPRAPAAHRLRRARRPGGASAVGRARQPVHGAVRTACHRVAEGGEPEGGGRASGAELGRDPRRDGPRGEARTGAAGGRAGAPSGRGREGVPAGPPLLHAGERSGAGPRAVHRRGPEEGQPRRLLGHPDGGAAEGHSRRWQWTCGTPACPR